MSSKERDFMRSEVTTLEALLSSLSVDRIIERIGIEERLRQARERLAEFETKPLAKSLPITFRGAPVEGMRSIDAGFASAALKAFIKATDTVTASLMSDELKSRGRLPSAGRSLRIIDMAHGSFGFELELPPPVADSGQMQPRVLVEEPDPYVLAIETTFALIRGAVSSDDHSLSDLIVEIHPRAAATICAFAKVLSDHEAGFAAEFEGKRVQLNEPADVQRVLNALKKEDIREQTEEQVGVLLGILPDSRLFECRLTDRRLISGKIDRGVRDIRAFKTTWENNEALLTFRVVSVRENQRFILTAATDPNRRTNA